MDAHPTTKYSERTDRQNNKKQGRSEAQGLSIQVAILKILASHDRRQSDNSFTQEDMAILATSGPEWSARMRRLAGRAQAIDIFASGYVLCDHDGWQITAEGRDFLRALEAVTQDNRLAEAGARDTGDRRRRRAPACGADRRRPSLQDPAAPCSGVASRRARPSPMPRVDMHGACAGLCAHAHRADPRAPPLAAADRGGVRPCLARGGADEPAGRQPLGRPGAELGAR